MENKENDLISKIKAVQEGIKQMSTSAEYVMWLNNFTILHPNFSNDEWDYEPNKLNENDLLQVQKLHMLYSAIENYAKRNYIYPIPCTYGGYYKIRLNENAYEIGCISGQGIIFFVKRVELDNENEFIDYNDIIANKEQQNVPFIKAQLEELSQKIKTLYDNNVPIEAIESTIDLSLKELEKEEKMTLKLKSNQ